MTNRVKILFLAFLLILGTMPAAGETDWEEISIKLSDSVWASSELEEFIGQKKVRYSAGNVFDDDIGTCWVEAADGDGTGESITFITNRPVAKIGLVNGFALSPALYEKNNRVSRIRICLISAFTAPGLVSETDFYLYFGRAMWAERPIEVKDTRDLQYFDFPFTYEEQESLLQISLESFLEEFPFFSKEIERELGYADTDDLTGRRLAAFFRDVLAAYSITCVRIEIEGVYRGSKYNDTCISEIDVVFD